MTARWRKSSHSNGNEGGCVEVSWRKSSYSNGGEGACVDVAYNTGAAMVAIRDSKNTVGPTLTIQPLAWSRFVRDWSN